VLADQKVGVDEPARANERALAGAGGARRRQGSGEVSPQCGRVVRVLRRRAPAHKQEMQTVPTPVASAFRRTLIDPLVALFLAPSCAACDRPLDEPTLGPVCDVCWCAIKVFTPPLCDVCGDPLPSWRVDNMESRTCPRCRGLQHAVKCSRAIGEYDGSLRAIIHALKYDRRRSLARPLARLLATHGQAALAGANIAVPVPLHRSRNRARGFNQAAEIARHLPLPTLSILKRTRATVSQTDLPAHERHANVKGAFALRPGTDVKGLVIVLVDDVSTTGATLEACARALVESGAREVRALTAARVASRPR
jgi:ComF family protein